MKDFTDIKSTRSRSFDLKTKRCVSHLQNGISISTQGHKALYGGVMNAGSDWKATSSGRIAGYGHEINPMQQLTEQKNETCKILGRYQW